MKTRVNLIFYSLFALLLQVSGGRSVFAQEAAFIPNKGQWEGNFKYKLTLSDGAMFFKEDGYRLLLTSKSQGNIHEHQHQHMVLPDQAFIVDMQWVGADNNISMSGSNSYPYYTNYFLGKDSNKWKSGVPSYSKIRYNNIYNNIHAEYFSRDGYLKYDLIIDSGGRVEDIKMKYRGQSDLNLFKGRLHIQSSLGDIQEFIPEAYQIIDGKRKKVNCSYVLNGDVVGFSVGKYNPDLPLIIDPVLIFSSFTGSVAMNFGYTATYDSKGNFYAGGTALGNGYPASPGVIQQNYGGGSMDVTINKFSEDGSQMIFATHLGGLHSESPHSLNITANDELLILGNTDSEDFPTTLNALQDSFIAGPDFSTFNYPFFDFGSNIFVSKISSDGKTLLASTYLGQADGEGINVDFRKNYGDRSRGDILSLANGDIAFTSTSLSKNLGLMNVGPPLSQAGQKAILVVMNSNLSQMRWGSYFGGSGSETGYSLKEDGGSLYISGATNSSDLPQSNTGVLSSNQGRIDGYIARFDQASGSLLNSTYIGTSQDDQCFFIDFDKDGNLYAHGQTRGQMPISSGVYGTPGAFQFIQKLSPDLGTLLWSTAVGSGNKSDWSPTAFMVDRCDNIYMSGWNGEVNNGVGSNTFNNSNTFNLPLTADAYQSTTDGSDFYFMILDRNAASLLYGSYFGGNSEEHVDGGTSRFSPKGIMYQAVCAGCDAGSFPTTPQSFSPTKPNSDCNLGAIKIDFQQTVRSLPAINISTGFDTICNELSVHLSNNSLHANKYFWDFGNGQTSTLPQPNVTYTSFGTYTITLIAQDTICDISDTNTITVNHSKGAKTRADFSMNYAGCDKSYRVELENLSKNANSYQWEFSDGIQSNLSSPTHNFNDTGTYTIRLIAFDNVCGTSDTVIKTLSFIDTIPAPQLSVYVQECSDGKLGIDLQNHRDRYAYSWDFNNTLYKGRTPNIRVRNRGQYTGTLNISDSICNTVYDLEFSLEVESIYPPIYIPNTFTPNGDGYNDRFQPSGENCQPTDYLRIFNRWGQMVFETNKPFDDFWDGSYNGKAAPQGVYSYSLKSGELLIKDYLLLIR